MIRYLNIGCIADENQLLQMTRNGLSGVSAYIFQKKLVEGIETTGLVVDTISGHCVPAYPYYKKLYIKFRQWDRGNSSINIDAQYLNLPLLNRVAKTISTCVLACQWAQKHMDDKRIFVFSLHTPFLLPAIIVKSIWKNTKILVLCGDLPEYMEANISYVKKFLKYIDRAIICCCLKRIDILACSSPYIYDKLPKVQENSCIVEGIVNLEEAEYLKRIELIDYDQPTKIIMLTGALELQDGIENLLIAFQQISKDNYELWITGFGSAVSLVKQYATKDSKIKFWGFIEDYNDFINMQRKASVLVATVSPTCPKSRYFFPSKVLEYLCTGLPVVTFKIGAFSEDYDKVLHYFDDERPHMMANTLINICELSSEIKRREAYERIGLLNDRHKKNVGKRLLKWLK